MYVSEVAGHAAFTVEEREMHCDVQASPAILCIQSKTSAHGIG